MKLMNGEEVVALCRKLEAEIKPTKEEEVIGSQGMMMTLVSGRDVVFTAFSFVLSILWYRFSTSAKNQDIVQSEKTLGDIEQVEKAMTSTGHVKVLPGGAYGTVLNMSRDDEMGPEQVAAQWFIDTTTKEWEMPEEPVMGNRNNENRLEVH